MFKIGDFARINKVTVKTLRHYDSVGLLRPEKIDSFTGYRYYTADQMPRLNKILAFRDAGFSLEEIKVILMNNIEKDSMKVVLDLKHSEMTNKLRAEQEKLVRLESLIKIIDQEDFIMNYDVIIKKIDPIRVASLRDIIEGYSEQGHLWQELGEHIHKNNAKIVSPCMVIYHDAGFKEHTVDAEIIEPIEGNLPETDRIKVKMLEGCDEMACVVHKGPYATLHMAYAAISRWIEGNNYQIVGPQRELYIKGEWITTDPNEYITEIQFPVKKI